MIWATIFYKYHGQNKYDQYKWYEVPGLHFFAVAKVWNDEKIGMDRYYQGIL